MSWFEENIPAELLDSTLFKFVVTLPNKDVVNVDIRTIFNIDMSSIEADLESTPSIIAYLGMIYSEMKCAVTVQDKRVRVRRARLLERFSKEARDANVKLQVDQLKALVESDNELMEMELNLAIRQRDTGKLYNAIEGMRLKHESLRSLAGFKKQNG